MAGKKTIGRVVIPRDVEGLLLLAQKIYDKHQADGATSILNSLQDYNWNDLGQEAADALAKHREAETLRRQMEQAYKDRDLLMSNIQNAIRATATMLKGANSKNPKRLGEWGIRVDDTPKIKKDDDSTTTTPTV